MGWSGVLDTRLGRHYRCHGGRCHIGSPRAWSMATVVAPKNRTIGFQLWRVRRLPDADAPIAQDFG
jgi:hypothetical protein